MNKIVSSIIVISGLLLSGCVAEPFPTYTGIPGSCMWSGYTNVCVGDWYGVRGDYYRPGPYYNGRVYRR